MKKRRTYKKYLRKIQADYLPRKQKYETYNRLFQERNSFSKTDTDATFMRMKDDYMRNGQLKPCYKLQIATENQYVLAHDLFPNPTDTKTLNPFLDSFLEQHNELPKYIVADAGYGSEENYMYINDILHKMPLILITYANYHKENKKTYRDSPFVVDNWRYFNAECKKKLLEGKTGSIYRKRKIDVEPVFGHLKAHLAFQRFHLRGKQGAKIDIGMALIALNLRKLGNTWIGRDIKKKKQGQF